MSVRGLSLANGDWSVSVGECDKGLHSLQWRRFFDVLIPQTRLHCPRRTGVL